MVKSKAEVGLMQKACEITGRARQRTFDEIEMGMTEREIARVFGKFMLQEGADRVAFVHICSKLPYNPTYLHFERTIDVGNTIYLDGGASVWTYTCDYPRLATVGPASPKQIKYHRILTAINRKMADTLRPGLKCSDLYKLAIKLFKEVGGISDFPLKAGRMGHGQGMMVTEPPSISIDDDTVLEPGFTLSTEPGFGDGLHIWEDVHVITDDGHEQLSTESEDLREV
jgi:Xaa-Pro dipeptidase